VLLSLAIFLKIAVAKYATVRPGRLISAAPVQQRRHACNNDTPCSSTTGVSLLELEQRHASSFYF
jgi:hypothetical protein